MTLQDSVSNIIDNLIKNEDSIKNIILNIFSEIEPTYENIFAVNTLLMVEFLDYFSHRIFSDLKEG